ncbi:hypothetical protein GCM10029992_18910 [Glycomyces albus]
MNLLVVGISHRSAAVKTLERLTLDSAAATRLAGRLLTGGEVREAVVLSTCNRVEVYAAAPTFHGALTAIVDELHELWGYQDGEASIDFASCGYVRHGADAVAHAFRVAAGLDSMVAGEPQILGQLRDAYDAAREADHVGRHLHELFQQALRVGKRVHAETDLDGHAPRSSPPPSSWPRRPSASRSAPPTPPSSGPGPWAAWPPRPSPAPEWRAWPWPTATRPRPSAWPPSTAPPRPTTAT